MNVEQQITEILFVDRASQVLNKVARAQDDYAKKTMAINAAGNVSLGVGVGMAAFLVKSVQVSGQLDEIQKTMAAVEGANRAAWDVAYIDKFAQRSKFMYLDLANAGRVLAIQHGNVKQYLGDMADLAATSGKSLAVVANLYARVISGGKEGGVSYGLGLKTGFTTLGVGRNQLEAILGREINPKKLAGSMTSEQLLSLVHQALEKSGKSGIQEKLAYTTLSGSASMVGDSITRLEKAIGHSQLPQTIGMLDHVAGLINRIASGFQSGYGDLYAKVTVMLLLGGATLKGVAAYRTYIAIQATAANSARTAGALERANSARIVASDDARVQSATRVVEATNSESAAERQLGIDIERTAQQRVLAIEGARMPLALMPPSMGALMPPSSGEFSMGAQIYEKETAAVLAMAEAERQARVESALAVESLQAERAAAVEMGQSTAALDAEIETLIKAMNDVVADGNNLAASLNEVGEAERRIAVKSEAAAIAISALATAEARAGEAAVAMGSRMQAGAAKGITAFGGLLKGIGAFAAMYGGMDYLMGLGQKDKSEFNTDRFAFDPGKKGSQWSLAMQHPAAALGGLLDFHKMETVFDHMVGSGQRIVNASGNQASIDAFNRLMDDPTIGLMKIEHNWSKTSMAVVNQAVNRMETIVDGAQNPAAPDVNGTPPPDANPPGPGLPDAPKPFKTLMDDPRVAEIQTVIDRARTMADIAKMEHKVNDQQGWDKETARASKVMLDYLNQLDKAEHNAKKRLEIEKLIDSTMKDQAQAAQDAAAAKQREIISQVIGAHGEITDSLMARLGITRLDAKKGAFGGGDTALSAGVRNAPRTTHVHVHIDGKEIKSAVVKEVTDIHVRSRGYSGIP